MREFPRILIIIVDRSSRYGKWLYLYVASDQNYTCIEKTSARDHRGWFCSTDSTGRKNAVDHYKTWRAALRMLIIVKRASCARLRDIFLLSILSLSVTKRSIACRSASLTLTRVVIFATSRIFFSSKSSFSPSIGRKLLWWWRLNYYIFKADTFITQINLSSRVRKSNVIKL